ncbi:MAG TPA: TlpA disulfide reductase family protein [Chthoniobacterales bacterium]|jgi:thiol-disulfide isomerase/thioredoxin|nr:TlpA disulfide reductase family protein [Chthoniobacterales bacterium]
MRDDNRHRLLRLTERWAFYIALALTALGGGSSSAETRPTLNLGDSGPPLDVHLLSGGAAPAWSELKGKVVVVDFWATWCQPCVAAFPALNKLHEEFAGKDVAFFSVTYEPDAHVREFLNKHPLRSQVAIDDSFRTFKAYGAWGIPVVFLFGRGGKLAAAVHPDHLTSEVLAAVLEGKAPDVPQSKPWDDPAGAEIYFRKLQQELQAKPATPTS